ncbi:MAG: AraC family transcriptional regulator [Paenibacillaceae bacterium]|nr:AraC family transcriptional regulator [Paenibacillaceae bacterium]
MRKLLRTFGKWYDISFIRRRLYWRTLTIVLLTATFPTTLVAVSTYYLGKSKIEAEANRTNVLRFQHVSNGITDKIGQLELFVSRWAFSPMFDEKLRNFDLHMQIDQIKDLMQSLYMISDSNPLVANIRLYLDAPAVLLSGDQGLTTVPETERNRLHSLLFQPTGLFWEYGLTGHSKAGDTPPAVSFVAKLPWYDVRPYGAIIVDLNMAELQTAIAQMNPDGLGVSMILRADGERLTATGKPGAEGSPLESALRREMTQAAGSSGTFRFRYDGNEYDAYYARLPRVGWTYVATVPLTALTESVAETSRWTIAVSLLVMAAALVISLLVSRTMYRPIRYVMQLLAGGRANVSASADSTDEIRFIERQWLHFARESSILQSRLEDQLPLLREVFLFQLIHGHYYYLSETELHNRMTQYGWDVDRKLYVAMIVELSGYSNLAGRFAEGDEQLVTFAAANIAGELAATKFAQTEIVNFQDLSVGVIAIFERQGDPLQLRSECLQFAGELADSLHRLLRMNIAIVIARLQDEIKQLPEVFKESRHALQYRDVQVTTQLLDLEELVPQGTHAVDYPFETEKAVIQAMRMGLEDNAAQAIGQFADDLRRTAATAAQLQQGMIQLLGNLLNAMRLLGFNPFQLYEGNHLHEQLIQLKEPAEMVRWFRHKVIAPFMAELHNARDVQTRLMVERVIRTIETRYMTDLSLEACAERHGTSPYSLSKAFKLVTGVNFIDYVTRIRIDTAKQLLLDTSLTINEIARRVGYQPPHLIRTFKKYERMTPGQYRGNRSEGE